MHNKKKTSKNSIIVHTKEVWGREKNSKCEKGRQNKRGEVREKLGVVRRDKRKKGGKEERRKGRREGKRPHSGSWSNSGLSYPHSTHPPLTHAPPRTHTLLLWQLPQPRTSCTECRKWQHPDIQAISFKNTKLWPYIHQLFKNCFKI